MPDPDPSPTPAPAPAPAPAPTPTPAPAPAPTPTPTPAPSWRDALPEDLRGNEDLSRMGSIEDLAKGYVETRSWAKGRVPIPSDAAGFKELGEKLRPETPAGYEFKVAEGADRSMADGFASFAHDTGLPKQWAEGAFNWYEGAVAKAAEGLTKANEDAIKAVELDMGTRGYHIHLDATGKMLEAAGLDAADFMTGLQSAVGADGKPAADKVLRGLFTLAEKYGELEKVDGFDVDLNLGTVTPEQAGAEAQRMLDADKEGKLRDENSAERKRYDTLVARAAQG